MTASTLEWNRRAARPLERHLLPDKPLSQFCMRCEREFTSDTLDRECGLCRIAAFYAFGTLHPGMEMSGT